MRSYLAFAAAFVALSLPLQAAQPIQQKLGATVKSYKLSEPTFLDALVKVASDFKIPMGVELVKSPSVLRPVKHSWRETKVRGVLAALVRGERGYVLTVQDGIVHIFNANIVNQPSNFLNVRIKRFDPGETSASAASITVWELVHARFETPNPGPHGSISTGIGGGKPEQTFSLDLHDATVRHILDAIALSSEHKIWVVTFAPGKMLTPTGFHRIASWSSNKVPPDKYQPGWQLLRWGEKPY